MTIYTADEARDLVYQSTVVINLEIESLMGRIFGVANKGGRELELRGPYDSEYVIENENPIFNPRLSIIMEKMKEYGYSIKVKSYARQIASETVKVQYYLVIFW